MTEEDAKRALSAGGKAGVHLAIKLSKKMIKKSGRLIAQGVGKGLELYDNRTRVFDGDKSLKQFIKFDKNKSSVIGKLDVSQTDCKEFGLICKKNGVDFAIVRDAVDPQTLHFFFSGKNAEVMAHLFETYAREKYQQDIKEELLEGVEDRVAEKQKQTSKEKEVGGREKPEPKKDSEKKEEVKKDAKVAEAAKDSVEPKDTDVIGSAEKIQIHIDTEAMEFELPEMER